MLNLAALASLKEQQTDQRDDGCSATAEEARRIRTQTGFRSGTGIANDSMRKRRLLSVPTDDEEDGKDDEDVERDPHRDSLQLLHRDVG